MFIISSAKIIDEATRILERMKKAWLLAPLVTIAIVGSGCSSSNDSTQLQTGGESTTGSADKPGGKNGDCPSEPFTGEVASAGDDANAAFSLSDGDIVLAQAFALAQGAQYTVYLADYGLGDQDVGFSTIEADDGQVVITMQARNPDQDRIEPGTPYDETFVIMDSGGGASGSPDEPEGTVTFIAVTDDRICFDCFDCEDPRASVKS